MVFLPSQWASCPHRGQRQYLIVQEFFDNQDFIKLFLNQILIMNNPERRLYFSLLRQGFSDYAQQTSLHGWQYIEVSNTWWGKIFWVFVSCQVHIYLVNIFLIITHMYLPQILCSLISYNIQTYLEYYHQWWRIWVSILGIIYLKFLLINKSNNYYYC